MLMHKEILGGATVFLYVIGQLDLVTFFSYVKSTEFMVKIATSGQEIKTVEEYTAAVIKMAEEDDELFGF